MYQIDKMTNSITALSAKGFGVLGFNERAHLQEWIAKCPECLGALLEEFQCFRRYYRLVKRAFLLEPNCVFSESWVSRLRESCDIVKIGFTFTGNGGQQGGSGGCATSPYPQSVHMTRPISSVRTQRD